MGARHGHSMARNGRASRTYSSWANMRSRCNNPNSTHYAYYGGRGIKVCERWKKFTAFLADMGECPKNMTLDRVDCEGDYCRENCCWASRATQSRNRRGNKLNAEIVQQLRAEFAAGERTGDLAAKYGITRQMVRKARKGECWGDEAATRAN